MRMLTSPDINLADDLLKVLSEYFINSIGYQFKITNEPASLLEGLEM